MFNIYPPDKTNCSAPINPVDFLTETWNNVKQLYPEGLQPNSLDNSQREQEIRNIMKVSLTDDKWTQLVEYCKPGDLNENTPFTKEMYPITSTHSPSYNYKMLKVDYEDAQNFKTIVRRRKNDGYFKKYPNLLSNYKSNIQFGSVMEIPLNVCPDINPGEDMLIYIRVYEPYRYNPCFSKHIKFNQELIVLGSHTLDALRDNIKCPNDLGLRYDMSNCPYETNLLSKEMFKSGFLYIEDTFYNDTRHSNNTDYSTCIKNWALTKPEIGPFNTGIMEDTAFFQLKIRLGYPQVYQHQGDCEHIFVFSNIEIVKPYDLPYSSLYPICKSRKRKNAQSCNICGKFSAKWMVTHSERVPFDPALFCGTCFYNYNYSNGKKIGNFKAYPYNTGYLM